MCIYRVMCRVDLDYTSKGMCKGKKKKKIKAFVINMITSFYFPGMILKGLQ